MTMASLLRHFGVDAERYVTASGRIIFDDVTKDHLGQFAHQEHGAVTPVSKHTFHGGVDEPDSAVRTREWWSAEGAMQVHVAAMESAFPDFVYLPATDEYPPCWGGTIDTGRGKFQVLVLLRHDGSLPSVRVVSKQRLGAPAGRRWEKSPHLYTNGNLCIADQADWDPESHTAATATAWAAHWLAAFTEWRMGRQWPVEGCHAVAS